MPIRQVTRLRATSSDLCVCVCVCVSIDRSAAGKLPVSNRPWLLGWRCFSWSAVTRFEPDLLARIGPA